MVERLVVLSCERGMFTFIREMFDHPIEKIPEYLLFSLSQAKPNCGHAMLDELLSHLLPIFLGNHANSSFVLGQLFQFNQALFIRGICELCKHD
jgi:CCR4-NOT transcription complex subunit 1